MRATKKSAIENKDFELKTTSFLPAKEYLHVYSKHIVCITDSRGYPQPDNKDLIEIRLDASNGFIPLWEQGVTLNWRFSKSFGSYFAKPDLAKAGVKKLLGEAILAWQDACPIKFHENNDAWDFEIAMHQENCDASGCVLASAFFPSPGQNIFYIYPTMFKQSYQEQVETMAHEIGHIFGLRHFFANITEKEWASEHFGTENEFSIMNYGDKSELTINDIKDLKSLYQLVWSGQLTEINGTKIKLFNSYHSNSGKRNKEIKLLQAEGNNDLKKLLSKYHATSSKLDFDKENIDLKVKRRILNVKGNYSTNPSEVIDELDLKTNLLYNSNDFILLAKKLNELISETTKKITTVEMKKCKTVKDCIILVNSKI